MEGDGSIGKRKREAEEHGGSSAKRLACSIDSEAFCCDDCDKILKPPIFQCQEGHFICSSCGGGDEPPAEAKCALRYDGCSGTLARSHGMERAVQSILVDCRHAEHGCTERTSYHDSRRHWSKCPYEPCECPEPGCGFAGTAAELLAHLTGHHKWPSTAFRYQVAFGLRVAEPGTRVLHCEDDGQVFLVSVQPAARPPGRAVSICHVGHRRKSAFCSLSFSCSTRHRITAWSPLDFDWPPTSRYICHVPRVSGAPDHAAVVLTISIDVVEEEEDCEDDDPDDSSYAQSDEDDDGDSS